MFFRRIHWAPWWLKLLSMQDTPYHERIRGFASSSELTLIVPQTDPVKTVSNFQSTPVAQLFEGKYSENDEEDDDEELDLFEGYFGEFSETATQLQNSTYRRDLDPLITEFEMFSRLLQGLDE